MRKKEKEIQDRETIMRILKEAPVIRIALCDEGQPYVVAMNFAYEENCIYLHSALDGRKIEVLKKNNRVAFQTDIEMGMIESDRPCNWSVHYLSLMGSGRAHFVTELETKKQALDIIMSKYSGLSTFEYLSSILEKTCLIRIDIEEMCGKRSG
ncbi:MAG TPA: pyridoxamine 5'-phosphate oxidase family protein [Syntrophomonadaceae bacterium]|nr:pyridoxamine 5'-phosphate oxidase family protein [Syntrophomonadaceae bacterium]